MPEAANDMAGQVDRICTSLGIRIVPVYRRRNAVRQTHARKHMRKILKQHGEQALRTCLLTIIETRNNGHELWSETIQAVSDVILTHPHWLSDFNAWLAAFNTIELAEVRSQAKQTTWPKRQTMRVILVMRLKEIFEPKAPTLL